ncbi:MAG: PEP-CTERM sorting domain-containing protein [Planctomycetaceae bacterium]|nr:PEP-CTERM sorting domain-containing protein [Planctomycetaceae bacterium]
MIDNPVRASFGARWQCALAIAVLMTANPGSVTNAGIATVGIYQTDFFSQIGDGPALIPNPTFGSNIYFRLFPEAAGGYDTVETTYSGLESPFELFDLGGSYDNQFGYLTRTELETAFPAGTYNFAATNGGGTDLASVDYTYTAANLPQSFPYLTGTDFSDLQGMNAGAPFTFHFSPYDPGTAYDSAVLALNIVDRTSPGFFSWLLPASTTEFTVPAGTLAPGHAYDFDLYFNNFKSFSGTGMANGDAEGVFTYYTIGQFTTASAVPEPSTLLIFGHGLVFLAWAARRREKSRIR